MTVLTNKGVQPGCKIKVYGQEARVSQVIGKRVYLYAPVVVPGQEYTRDYCSIDEIQEIDWAEFIGFEE